MKINNQTILITGGSRGIGLAMTYYFRELGNEVIITGKNPVRLKRATDLLKGVKGFVCDITCEEDVNKLVELITEENPQLSILINNTAQASAYRLSDQIDIFTRELEETTTNYLSVVRLTQKLLPILQQQVNPAIINISSIVGLVPCWMRPTYYSSSKAALHSYTQNLRLMLEDRVKVFEVFLPLVNTDFSRENGGENIIDPEAVAEQLIEDIQNDQYEIFVACADFLYELYRNSPEQVLQVMDPTEKLD